jgi:hypothetical protein
MSNDFIRVATEEDLHLIESYFKAALNHYEETGDLIAMQEIRYFIQNMYEFSYYVKQESTVQITYIFEFPATADGKRETGNIVIPLQNN